MKEFNLKHEAKRYGCAVLAATIMALNIKTFVHLWGLRFHIHLLMCY